MGQPYWPGEVETTPVAEVFFLRLAVPVPIVLRELGADLLLGVAHQGQRRWCRPGLASSFGCFLTDPWLPASLHGENAHGPSAETKQLRLSQATLYFSLFWTVLLKWKGSRKQNRALPPESLLTYWARFVNVLKFLPCEILSICAA